MKFAGVLVISLMFPLLAALPAMAGTRFYRGAMEAVTAPGSTCEGVLGKHPVTIVIIEDSDPKGLSGYFESDVLDVGKLAGPDPAHLNVGYPWQDSNANSMSLTSSGATTFTGELNGVTTVKHCTFSTSRLTLDLVDDEKAAAVTSKRLATQFEAIATLSQGFSLTRDGDYNGALPLFEKSLGLAAAVFGQGSPKLNHFVIGLANCYSRLGREKEFNTLYEQRVGATSNEILKSALVKLRAGALAQQGRKLLDQGEYDAALKMMMQAYKLDPRNKDSIHTVMAAYFRAGRYDEAISFLEQASIKLEEADDRKEINDIIALVYFKKSLKDAKSGKDTDAEISLRKAVALNPQSPRYLEALARMRHKAGHFDEAQKLLNQGLKQLTDESSRLEIMAVQEKMRQTEMIIRKIQ